MRVEPFNFPLENSVLKKIDLMIARCTQNNPKRDAVLLIEGAEGEGKTTYSVAVGYYCAWKTGRSFNEKNVFSDLREMIDFLKTTDNQIAIWDEPALQGLSKDALSTIVKDLERLLMMSRKKRHFIMINMAYFNMFSSYIVWQRPLGMIHVYSRDEVTPGRFVYIKKRSLEQLWHDWRSKRRRNYRKHCSKSIRGSFPDVLNPHYKNNVISHFNLDEYERKKDEAIMKIGEKREEINKTKLMLQDLKAKISNIDLQKTKTKKELAEHFGIRVTTLYKWNERYKENKEIAKEIKV